MRWFPALRSGGWEITSEATPRYNCVAFAAGDLRKWWWPTPGSPFTYWPEGVLHEESMQGFIEAFHTLGFEVCGTGELEQGYEKLAIYADPSGQPTHIARQELSGNWVSKLGRLEDIRHDNPGLLAGPCYGEPVAYMRRKA